MQHSLALGPVVDWTAVTTTVHALRDAGEVAGMISFERVVALLTDPLRRLDRLAGLAQQALNGDDHAKADLRAAVASTIALTPQVRGLFARFIADADASRPGDMARCDCMEQSPSRPAPPQDGRASALHRDVLDESELVALVLAIARIHSSQLSGLRSEPLDAVIALLVAAEPFVSLANAYRERGAEGLLDRLESIVASAWFPSLDIGSLAIRAGSIGPGSPGLPGGWPGAPPIPDVLGKTVQELVAAIKNRRNPASDLWEPVGHLIRELVAALPSGWLGFLACLKEVSSRVAARAAIAPPARPARVTWTDGISLVTLAGACAGDRLVIHGHGFAAARQSAVLLLPFVDGCHPVTVPAGDWTDSTITVTLPTGVVSGPVGFADAAYIAAYDSWVADQNRLAEEIRQFPCYRLAAPFNMASRFGECPPDIGLNHIRAGAPVIQSFAANGRQSRVVVAPGTSVVLAWTVRNAEHIRLTNVGSTGPLFGGLLSVDDPSGTSYDLGPFGPPPDLTDEAFYELRATGPCGAVTATVSAVLRPVPVLQIAGVEVTQAIQTFPESIALVALKDTIVRAHVAVTNFGGFPQYSVGISGEAEINGVVLPPINPVKPEARSFAVLTRSQNYSLNFRIPAALATGTKWLRVKAWTVDEFETAPEGVKTRPFTWPTYRSVTWVDKRPFRVRYVRVSHDAHPALSDAQGREVVLRAFDLLATPPTDIAAARLPTWNTSLNLEKREGTSDLLEQIDDQHDCAFSEWLLPWGDECPDDDGAVWVGITPTSGWGGMAEGHQLFLGNGRSRNTVVVTPTRITAAHELGHTLMLNHVDTGNGGTQANGVPFDETSSFDTLPNGGAIQTSDAFDPAIGHTVVGEGAALFDFMSYALDRWVSPTNWKRVFDKF